VIAMTTTSLIVQMIAVSKFTTAVFVRENVEMIMNASMEILIMTRQELKAVIDQQKQFNIGLIVLVSEKKLGWRPKGFKLRTPFGLARILNLQDRKDFTQVVFQIETKKVEAFYNRNLK
jgi:hypothetical protein